MTFSFEKISSDIFNSVSSKIRLQILRLLDVKGSLPYTEIMFSLKLDPVRDAGKFVYHLKNLMEPGLITLDKDKKKYMITDLGIEVIKFARELEEYVAIKKGKLYVRTSRFSIEEFNKERIINSLTTEANTPYDLAEEIATEAEERLIQLRTTYLTAPLIREFVNSILIEKGLDEYRHKLTRLGMPIYDVYQLFKTTGQKGFNVEKIIYDSGSSVIEEYALLTSLPRDIADSHLSGSLHITDLNYWPLKPNEVVHDIRFFFKNGLSDLRNFKTFESALEALRMIYLATKAESYGEQSIDMFNIFLAPFVEKIDKEKTKDALKFFFYNLHHNQMINVNQKGISLCLEPVMPSFLKNVKAIGPKGKISGTYGDFEEESQLLFDLILEVFAESSQTKPFINPHPIIKVRGNFLKKRDSKQKLLKAFRMASKIGLPYFMFLGDDERICFSASGSRLDNNWSKNWEIDCLRTGNMATIFINLPRIVYESNQNEQKLNNILENLMLMVKRAFIEKRKTIRKRSRQNLLPFLSGQSTDNQYFNEDNATYTFSFIGLYEAVRAYTGSSITKEDGIDFGLEIINRMKDHVKIFSQETDLRFVLAQSAQENASARLAELDIERFGRANAKVSGMRSNPFYNDVPIIPLTERTTLEKRLEIDRKFQDLLNGGHISLICLDEKEHDAANMSSLAKKIIDKKIEFFAFANTYTFCKKCNSTSRGIKSRCPSCNSSSTEYFGRSSSLIIPFNMWNEAKRRIMNKWVRYSPRSKRRKVN